ncbi:YceD family protein [Leeia oryzae]|uniref:YceD family protein n=1 Tax=Leeia oryzae TaxID=356662 RepID=UPI00035E91B2|nr:YceD family protein [Leeia oryzae]
MSEQFIIHNLRFAEGKEQIDAVLPQSSFARLSAEVVRPTGDVHFRLTGGRNSLGLPVLDLAVSTTVELVCQRCMNVMTSDIVSESRLVVVDKESLIDEYDSDEEDAILEDAEFSVLELVEDELLLVLPASPRHEMCVDSSAAKAAAEANKKPNPFAVLAELKNR